MLIEKQAASGTKRRLKGNEMHLKRMTLENFRSKEHLALDFGSRLTLFLGENGSGKTSILDGIAIGLGAVFSHLPNVVGRSFSKNGDIRQSANKLAPYTRISLETTTGLKWDRMLRRDKSATTLKQSSGGFGVRDLKRFLDQTVIDPENRGETYPLPLFVYYGVSRALLDLPLRRRGFPKKHHRFEALANALNADSRFKSAFVWFYNKENEEYRLQKEKRDFDVTLKELDAVRTAISGMFADVSEPHIKLSPLRFAVKHKGEWLNIANLSDGYKTLLALVIDLSARMAMANPHLDDPLQTQAVVMIDEVDLHLHPSWQQHVMGDLLKTFPRTQFVLTTHSPFIVEALNNHLQKTKILNMPVEDEDEEIKNILPVSADQIAAYVLGEGEHKSLMDPEAQLLDNTLLSNFNAINLLYEKMRDIEWSRRGD